MLVNRFVIRRDGVRERRGIPLALRNALRRHFIRFVERTDLRNAEVFLAAANANQQPPPPNNRVSFITTPRLNQLAMYVPTNAPAAQVLALNQYIVNWLSVWQQRGYSLTATDPRWRIQTAQNTDENGVASFAWVATERIFYYGNGIIGEQ
jgi:hypothetical protein